MVATKIKYWQNTYCYNSLTKIQASGKDEKGFFIIPESTIFYPAGGGQPMDVGYISVGKDEIKIIGTDFNSGAIKHYLASEREDIQNGEEVEMKIQSQIRLLNASLHTAGHWIAGIVTENLLLPFSPIKAYHYPDGPYIEFSGDKDLISDEIIDQINMAIKSDRQAQLKVTAEIIKEDLISDTNYDLKLPNLNPNPGLPRRMVTIETYKAIGCGGTHVDSIYEIKDARASKIYLKNGKIRVGYEIAK